MKPRTFIAFVGPSVALMLIFIAAPLVSVLLQSFQNTQTLFEEVTTESCTPGFPQPVCKEVSRTIPVIGDDGTPVTETSWVGLENYETLTQPERVAQAFEDGGGISEVLTIDFWSALRFTLSFTLITLPLVVGLGLLIAITVNNAVKAIRGPVIFISLLPFIITPVIGALSIRWLFYGDGILTAALESLTGQDISMAAQGWTIEALMLFYRVWHVAPFAFVIFYAGLQTLNQDSMDAAVVDGASRWQRVRYVLIPHLMPLIVFVGLIHLMDSYRVFEEIIGFSSEAYRISLQFLTFDLLTPDDSGNRAVGRASASSMLTMIGIVILLIPLVWRVWRDHKRG